MRTPLVLAVLAVGLFSFAILAWPARPAEAAAAGSITLGVDPVTWKFARHAFDRSQYPSASVGKTGDATVSRGYQYDTDTGRLYQNFWGYTYIYFPKPSGVPADAAVDAYLRVIPTPNGWSYPTTASIPVTVDAIAANGWLNYPEGNCREFSDPWSPATCPEAPGLGVALSTQMPLKDGTGTPVTLDASGAARAWFKAGSANHGLKVGTPGGTPTQWNYWQFYGHFYGIGHATAALRPQFVVEWYSRPLGLRTTGSTPSSISLAWDAAGNPSGTLYQVLRNGSVIHEGPALAFTDTGLSAGVTYQYQVRSKSPKGDVSSPSDPVSGTIPNPPGGLAISDLTSTGLRLTWTANGNPQNAEYYAVLTELANGRQVAPGWTPARLQDFAELAPNTAYRLTVRARLGAVESAPAEALAVTTLARPAGPGTVIATQSSITVGWDASGNPPGTHYAGNLIDAASGSVLRDFSWMPETRATFDGLTPGTAYRVVVRARNAAGAETDAVTVAERRTIPRDVTGLAGESGALGWSQTAGRGWVKLTWERAPGADGYLLDVFDGSAYRTFDLGDAAGWDSRESLIYPTEAYLDTFADNTLTTDAWNRVNGGLDLRDTPRKLYRKTPGVRYDATDQYVFHVRPYNESGDAGWKEDEPSHWYRASLPQRTDADAPTVHLAIDGGAAQTGSNAVPLTVSYDDALSGVSEVRFSHDGALWGGWQAVDAAPGTGEFAHPRWNLLAGPGTRLVYAQARDRAGNVSDPAMASIWVAYETTNPTVRVSINGGAETAVHPDVALTVDASSAVSSPAQLEMSVSNDGLAFTDWEPYVGQRRWTLSPGDGLKTVTVRVRNRAGHTGQALAQIRLTSVGGGASIPGSDPPVTVVGATASVSLIGHPAGVALVNHRRVTLRLQPATAMAGFTVSTDGVQYSPVEPLAAHKTMVLPGGDGPKTVYVRFVDGAGVETAVFPVDVVVDTTPPEVQARWLGDASVTTGEFAELIITAADGVSAADALAVSFDRGGTWQPLADTMAVAVTRAGHNLIPVWVRDQAGNERKLHLEIYRTAGT